MTLFQILEQLHTRLADADWDVLEAQAEDPVQITAMAAALRAMDRHLTGKTMDHKDRYESAAVKVLGGEVVVLHLADGGYSRLGVRFTERPFLWIDRSASRPKVVDAWDKLERP